MQLIPTSGPGPKVYDTFAVPPAEPSLVNFPEIVVTSTSPLLNVNVLLPLNEPSD